MDFEKIDKNEIFLLVGEDFEKVNSSILKKSSYLGIDFYIVDNFKIINSPSGYKCSCDGLLCWHILKVIFDKENAVKSITTIEDFSETNKL